MATRPNFSTPTNARSYLIHAQKQIELREMPARERDGPIVSRLPAFLFSRTGARQTPTARQQPEALARLGPATQRQFLQESCGAAAQGVKNP
jgi:hypothetical protein